MNGCNLTLMTHTSTNGSKSDEAEVSHELLVQMDSIPGKKGIPNEEKCCYSLRLFERTIHPGCCNCGIRLCYR